MTGGQMRARVQLKYGPAHTTGLTGRTDQPLGRMGGTRAPTWSSEIRQLARLSAEELSDLYCAGQIGEDTLAAIDAADVAAREQRDRAKARRAVDDANWYEAAYAQYEASLPFTKGNMFSRFYLQEQESRNARLAARGLPASPESDGMVLWAHSEDWARKRASWELCQFWDANGGRLSKAAWRQQQAMAARADRDARDLAAMAAGQARQAPRQQARPAPRPVAAPVAPRQAVKPGSFARAITALGAWTRAANRATEAARELARVSGGMAT